MSDLPDGPDAPAPSGPKIGADEWVARSGERRLARGGVVGRLRGAYDQLPKAALFGICVAVAALLPLLTSRSSNDIYYLRVGTVTLVYALLALGLNVAVGFTGLLDLGYIAYYGVGAYGYAMLSSSKFGVHWQAWASIPVVVVFAACLGFVLALPSRRLVGDYLAIVTLFFGQIFYTLVTQGYRASFLGFGGSHDLTGGPNGIANVDRFRSFGAVAESDRAYFYIALVAVVIVFAALHLATHSRTGRAWRALHDDPLAAQVMSIPINRLKVLAIGVGAAVGALAGTINAALLQGAFPDDYTTQVLIVIYAMVILGGSGSLPGAVLGAIVVNIFMLEALRPQTPISSWTFNGRWLFYGGLAVVLIATMRPWRRLAVVAGGAAAFGFVLHGIVGAVWPRGVHGLISTGPTEFTHGGWMGWAIRNWLFLPANTYDVQKYTFYNVALVGLIACALALTLLRGWKRDALLVPTLWLAGFVWETRLVEEGSGPTRYLLLGVTLIVVMTARPQGLLGKPRVEIV